METNSYKGWLNSDNFFKRTVAVYLYGLLGNCTIGCFFYALFFGTLLITGVLSEIGKSVSNNTKVTNTQQEESIQEYK